MNLIEFFSGFDWVAGEEKMQRKNDEEEEEVEEGEVEKVEG